MRGAREFVLSLSRELLVRIVFKKEKEFLTYIIARYGCFILSDGIRFVLWTCVKIEL